MLNLATQPNCGTWLSLVRKFFEKNTILAHAVETAYSKGGVTPSEEDLFKALRLCSLGATRVVILGQDPYPKAGDADGLAFSSKSDKLPRSLANILKELKNDLAITKANGDLTGWASQGVLLLNTSMSTAIGKINGHKKFGWDKFTDHIIDQVSFHVPKVVFILWGKEAEKREHLIDKTRHLVIKSNHPSPLSANKGFNGSKPFSKANAFLETHNLTKIDWNK